MLASESVRDNERRTLIIDASARDSQTNGLPLPGSGPDRYSLLQHRKYGNVARAGLLE